ncbi:MAG: DUF815 domain-containing protein [Pseudomonadota bacterium]
MAKKSEETRAELARIADALERLAPPPPSADILASAQVFIWEGAVRRLRPVSIPSLPEAGVLVGLDRAKARVAGAIEAFAAGRLSNHVLLWGARGTGKSALALGLTCEALAKHAALKLIEVRRDEAASLPDLLPALAGRPERVLLYCDDLSFEAPDATYKALKSALGGGVEAAAENVLVLATSNRKHLAPRAMAENEDRDAIRRGEAGHERLSLADRFGISIGFYELTEAEYLAAVESHAGAAGLAASDDLRREARAFAVDRGARSGRTAAQFVAAKAGGSS